MQRVSRPPVSLLLAAAALLVLHAQQTTQRSAKVIPRQFALLIPYAPPVTGAPFTAEYAIQVEKPLAGGGSETWHSMTRVARDSDGRIRHELHDYVPASFTKEPPLFAVILLDPVARIRHTLDPVRQTDDRQWLHAPHSSPLDSIDSTGEDLGTQAISGLLVKGVRRRLIVPLRQGASGQSDHVVDETWYSKELQLVVFEQQTDSAGLRLTITLSQLDRSAPDASLFKVPHGYHMPSPNHATAGGSMFSIAPADQTPNISGSW